MIWSEACEAQAVLDLNAKISQLLAQFPQPVGNKNAVRALTKTGPVVIADSDIPVFGVPTRKELTEAVSSWSATVINCESIAQQSQVQIVKQFSHATTLSIDHQVVSSSSNTSASQTYGYSVNPVSGSRWMDQKTRQDQSGTVDQRVTTALLGLGGNTRHTVQLKIWPIRYTVPFTANITVDFKVSDNLNKYQNFSDFASPQARTIQISGEVTDVSASDGQLVISGGSRVSENECSQGAAPTPTESATVSPEIRSILR
jgi:hypothetical protein